MITCKDCGAQAIEGVGYCPSCGARLPYRQASGKVATQNPEQQTRSLFNQMAVGRTIALIVCLIFFAWTGMNVDSWKDKLPDWMPFSGQNQSTSDSRTNPTSDAANEYRESEWTNELIQLLQSGKIEASQALIAKQVERNPLNERIYERAGTLLAEHGYRSEAVAIWLEGMTQTGVQQVPQLMRTHLTPSDIPVSPVLIEAVNKLIPVEVSELSWSDLSSIHMLTVRDEATDSVLEVQNQNELQVLLDQSDSSWSIAEWVWLPELTSLRWESSVSPDVRSMHALPQLQHLRLKNSLTNQDELATIYAMKQLRSVAITDGELASLEGIENLQMLTHLTMSRSRATSLSPLQALPNLNQLHLTGNHSLASAEELGSLTTLKELVIEGGELLQLQAIHKLQQLESLTLRRTAVKDISFVTQLPLLHQLTLESNHDLTNWRPLGQLTNLEQLHLKMSAIDAMPELVNLTQLKVLSLEGVRDIQPLAALTNLQHLALSGTSARSNLNAISQLTQLESLSLSDGTALDEGTNQIFALSSLKRLEINRLTIYDDMNGISQLGALEELVINHSAIPLSLSALSGLQQLKVLALNDTSFLKNISIQRNGPVSHIYYDHIPWEDQVQNWHPPANLTRLELASNDLNEISFSVGLTHLRELIIPDNSLTTIEPLANLPSLQIVDVRNNPILDQQPIKYLSPETLLLMD